MCIELKWIVNGKNGVSDLYFFTLGYALDPSLDNHQVSTKYIGSVEEAEKNQGNLFEIFNIKYIYLYLLSCRLTLDSRKKTSI